MKDAKRPTRREHPESYRYNNQELDLMDAVPPPRLNPWLGLLLLILVGFIYVWFWAYLLRG